MWPHQLSKDKSVVKEFLHDPLNKVDGMRACYASASLNGSRKLRELVDTFPAKKISICFGGDDTVTSLKVSLVSIIWLETNQGALMIHCQTRPLRTSLSKFQPNLKIKS